MSKYHKKKKFQCPDCEKSFDKSRQIKNHLIDVHNKNLSKKDIENLAKPIGEIK